VTSRTPRSDGIRTRAAIVREAVSLATVDGLDGLTIGNLAGALEMSKSGLYAHFGSKQELQLATVDEARRIFDAEVVAPAMAAPPGVARLLALVDAFTEHLGRRTFPGGCFFTGRALEMAQRTGPVTQRLADFQRSFLGLIRESVRAALDQGELPADHDLDELAFQVQGIVLAANTGFVVSQDPAVLDVARRAVRRLLGVEAPARRRRRS